MSESKKSIVSGIITKISSPTTDMSDFWIKAPEIVGEAKAGQFVSVYPKDGSRLLPRPISICEINKETGELRLVFRIAGEGTKEISTYKEGESIKLMGPLGNGFDKQNKSAILIGGGVGIPPMKELARELRKENPELAIATVLGYRDADAFLSEEFKEFGPVFIATEDGSLGTKGNVMDAIFEEDIQGEMIYACGPKPMLKAIQTYAKDTGILAQISMEERMACGIGACLACVCKSEKTDHHTNVKNKRVCKDGPVFYSDEITL